MLALMRQRNFALLCFGQLISSLGDWVLWIALPFFIYQQTESALATGAMFIIQTLPPILFGSLAGVFVDRRDRRWTMVLADLTRGGVLLIMLVALIPGWLWLLYPIAFIDANIAQFFKPAKSALIPQLVGKENLLAANRLISLTGDLSMLIGPALGAFLIGLIGIANVILIDAGSFVVSAAMIYLIHCPPAKEQQTSGAATASRSKAPTAFIAVWQEWLAGFQVVRRQRQTSTIFGVIAVAMLGQGIISVVWIVFVREKLAGGPFEYGVVQIAVAAGGIVGALLLDRVGRAWRPTPLIAYGGMLTGLLLLTTFNLPYLPVILGLQFLNGIPAVAFFVTIDSLLQSVTPSHYLGRVFGAFQTTNALFLLGGQGIATLLGDHLNSLVLLNTAGSLYFLSGVVALLLLPKPAIAPTGALVEPMAE